MNFRLCRRLRSRSQPRAATHIRRAISRTRTSVMVDADRAELTGVEEPGM
jgi:hypothetical protein